MPAGIRRRKLPELAPKLRPLEWLTQPQMHGMKARQNGKVWRTHQSQRSSPMLMQRAEEELPVPSPWAADSDGRTWLTIFLAALGRRKAAARDE